MHSIELQALGSVISGCGAFVSGCLAILTIFDADAWGESPLTFLFALIAAAAGGTAVVLGRATLTGDSRGDYALARNPARIGITLGVLTALPMCIVIARIVFQLATRGG